MAKGKPRKNAVGTVWESVPRHASMEVRQAHLDKLRGTTPKPEKTGRPTKSERAAARKPPPEPPTPSRRYHFDLGKDGRDSLGRVQTGRDYSRGVARPDGSWFV